MYKVRYYMVGDTLVHKLFATFSEAMLFAVYKVRSGDVYGIDKV